MADYNEMSNMTPRKLTLHIECIYCHNSYPVHMDQRDYDQWKNGTSIGIALNYLSPGQRELLLSQICDTCFDEMFDEKNFEQYESDSFVNEV